MKPKPNHGGSRPGSGRPKKEPTVTVSFRVKVRHVEVVKETVRKLRADLAANNRGNDGQN